MNWYLAVRWIHVFAAASWFGEVVTINFVLVPALRQLNMQQRARFLNTVFPRIFRLASVLSATTVVTGAVLFVKRVGLNVEAIFGSASATFLAIGAIMGLALTFFHFFMEPRLAKLCHIADAEGNDDVTDSVVSRLRVVPRGGLAFMSLIVLFMMLGARGF